MNKADRSIMTSCHESSYRDILSRCPHEALGRAETGQSSQGG